MPNLENGYELIEGFLDSSQLQSITSELETANLPAKVGGIRNADKKFNSISRLAQSELLIMKAQKYLRGAPKLVRAILFNKTFNNNWLVTWHQDRTVAVSTKFECDGWKPWSIKDNIHHVQPPIEVLNYMVTLRIHLDDTDENNGCLKVIPKSHMFGILPQDKIFEHTKKYEQVSCIGKRGSALVMRPHILHSSSKATNSTQRRVLHIEYSSYKLPEGVAWA